jgi:hypothetical protein
MPPFSNSLVDKTPRRIPIKKDICPPSVAVSLGLSLSHTFVVCWWDRGTKWLLSSGGFLKGFFSDLGRTYTARTIKEKE